MVKMLDIPEMVSFRPAVAIPYVHFQSASRVSLSRPTSKPYGKNFPHSHHAYHPSHRLHPNPPLNLSSSQELVALVSFMTSSDMNSLPFYMNPKVPLDPHVVFDFDMRSKGAMEEIERLRNETWANHPVVLFSELESPASIEAKYILDLYKLYPPPTIFEVDSRFDEPVLKPTLIRICGGLSDETASQSIGLPIILIGGEPVPGLKHLREAHLKGKLKKRFHKAWVWVGGP